MVFGLILLALIVGIALFFMSIFNRLVRGKNQVQNAYAQIDVQLKRRHDLIPNLVNVAKRYLTHEEDTLTKVISARNQAISAQQNASGKLDSSQQMQQLAQAEGGLTRALGGFYATMEAYPELKADATIREVMEELTNTENRIGFARQHYNDSVMGYNNDREVFPNNIVTGMFTFPTMSMLEFDDKVAISQAPVVDMSR
ncbi:MULTISPECIES: LemA family protein [unclassified Moraxella]|uniref:LemA family protein n=1 Tax=unclassified Moraxella TaxID=2685852 RepID=UPI003AF50D37